MLEVEMKFPVADFAPLEGKLRDWGAHAAGVRQEADHYFNAPDRDFARTDEALRLRRIGFVANEEGEIVRSLLLSAFPSPGRPVPPSRDRRLNDERRDAPARAAVSQRPSRC